MYRARSTIHLSFCIFTQQSARSAATPAALASAGRAGGTCHLAPPRPPSRPTLEPTIVPHPPARCQSAHESDGQPARGEGGYQDRGGEGAGLQTRAPRPSDLVTGQPRKPCACGGVLCAARASARGLTAQCSRGARGPWGRLVGACGRGKGGRRAKKGARSGRTFGGRPARAAPFPRLRPRRAPRRPFFPPCRPPASRSAGRGRSPRPRSRP